MAAIVMVKTFVAVRWELSEACTVIVNTPAVVGVPLMSPELARSNPFGRLPLITTQLYGAVPPAAFRVALYDTDAVPPGKLGGVAITKPVPTSSLNC